MRAIAYDRFGPLDVMHVSATPEPSPGRRDVLIAVRACALNIIDIRTRNGAMGPLVGRRFPKIPCSDVAGVVISCGPGVSACKVGDRVFGASDPLKGGMLAEQALVPEGQVAPMPECISFEEAAATPIASLAALYALRELGSLKDGQDVLVHGAGGPVGLYAIQLAKLAGGVVTAVTSSNGVPLARAFKADRIIDYQKAERIEGSYDIVINASGKMPYAVGRQVLKPQGRLVEPSPSIPTFIGSILANVFRSRRHLMLTTVPQRRDLLYIADLLATGRLKTTIARVFPFSRAIEAFAAIERGGNLGKIVVQVAT